MNPKINELGNTYGTLTVIAEAKDKNGRGAWLCQCECGNTKIVRGSDLRRGRITTCGKGCPYKSTVAFRDETGNTFGELTVLYRASNSLSGRVRWHCKCSCGNEIDVEAQSLRKGHTRSCGCKTKEFLSNSIAHDLKGQTFGYLTVLHRVGTNDNHEATWECECKCGKHIIIPGHRLVSGKKQSCGCKKESRYETAVRQVLEDAHIQFAKEYTFKDLYSENDKPFRFDFVLLNNNQVKGLIEVHGQQHYKAVDLFGGQKGFLQRQQYDKIKSDYCKNNKIPLLVIKYDNENYETEVKQFIEKVYNED